MSTPYPQIHYRCAFTLVPTESSHRASWSGLIRCIRDHAEHTVREQQFPDWNLRTPQFYKGYDRYLGRHALQTKRLVGTGSDDAPQYWAMRLLHPDRERPLRLWQMDVGVAKRDAQSFEIAVVISHQTLPDYVGPPLPEPVYTRPRLVFSLVDNSLWRAYAGSQRLVAHDIPVTSASVPDFMQALVDPGRSCPLILLTHLADGSAPLLHPAALARELVGSATVYVAQPDAYTPLKNALPDTHFCYAGYARVYWPQVDLSSAADGKRHRYSTRMKIEAAGAAQIQQDIVYSLARRARYGLAFGIQSIDDIMAKERELRLSDLRAQGQETREILSLYEQENTSLHAQIRELNNEVTGLKQLYTEVENERDEAENELETLRHWKTELSHQNQILRRQAEEQRSQLARLAEFPELPDSGPQVLKTIGQLFPSRVVFMDSARESAAEIDRRMVNETWKTCWALATVLYDLYFENTDAGLDIEQEFQARTGIEFAKTEGKTTKRDSQLMAQRKMTYDGRDIDITPHLKIGNQKPRLLRIHFAVLHEHRLIVVGHCGDHLDNATTRNRR